MALGGHPVIALVADGRHLHPVSAASVLDGEPERRGLAPVHNRGQLGPLAPGIEQTDSESQTLEIALPGSYDCLLFHVSALSLSTIRARLNP